MSNYKEDWQILASMVANASDIIIEAKEIKEDMLLKDDLNISSLMSVNLVVDLEKAFDIKIRESDFSSILNVGDLWRLVISRRSELS